MPAGEYNELDKCHWVRFINESGETIPPYAPMRVTGTTTRQGQPFFTCSKPTGTDQKYYPVNGGKAVADGNVGECTFSVQAIVAYTGSASVMTEMGPENDSWELGSGGTGFFYLGGKTTQRTLTLGEWAQVASPTSEARLADWGQVNDSSTQSFTGDTTWRQVTFAGGSDNGGVLPADTANDAVECTQAAPTILVSVNAVYLHTDTGASATFGVVGAVQFAIRRNGSIQNPTWANQSVLGTDSVFPATRFTASEIVYYSTASANDLYELWVSNSVDINITQVVLTLIEQDPAV